MENPSLKGALDSYVPQDSKSLQAEKVGYTKMTDEWLDEKTVPCPSFSRSKHLNLQKGLWAFVCGLTTDAAA